jgi:hypothetical protein
MSHKVLLTPKYIEKVEGIPQSTQAKGRMRGDFCPFVKIGRRVYYTQDDFDAYVSSHRRRSTSDDGTALMGATNAHANDRLTK